MNWKKWSDSKGKYYLAIVLFIVAYLSTIPWRNYERLFGEFIDISQGVPIWAHLIIIVIASIFVTILLKIIEIIVKKTILKT